MKLSAINRAAIGGATETGNLEKGGARPPIVLVRQQGGRKTAYVGTGSDNRFPGAYKATLRSRVGDPASLPDIETLSPAECFVRLLPALASSISNREACTSSVAEITGNNSTNRQPTSTNAFVRQPGPETVADLRACRQSRKRGSASISQIRLRIDSIARFFAVGIRKQTTTDSYVQANPDQCAVVFTISTGRSCVLTATSPVNFSNNLAIRK